MANNTFLVSAANVYGRDPNTLQAVFMGKANISSALSISTAAQEVRGGIGNPLLYIFYHSRKVEIKIESATFAKAFLGLNVGNYVSSTAITAVQSECVTLSSGVGTCTLTPTSDVGVFLPDGTIQTVTPAGKSFTVSGGGSLSVDIIYNYSTTVDQITVSTSTPPKVIDLVMLAEVRDNTGVVVNNLEILIPRFQVSGNYTMSLAANGVSTDNLEGMALEVASTDCTSGAYFCKIAYLGVATSATPTSSIAAMPATLSFTPSVAGTQNISVVAIKGTAAVNVTTSCSFVTSSGSWTAGLHTGAISITGSNANSGASGSVVVTYYDSVSGSTFSDSVNLVVS